MAGNTKEQVSTLLSKTKPLNAAERLALQQHLNTLGFNAGSEDGILWGTNSTRAIMGFLDAHPTIAPTINDDMRVMLVAFGHGEKLSRLAEALPESQQQAVPETTIPPSDPEPKAEPAPAAETIQETPAPETEAEPTPSSIPALPVPGGHESLDRSQIRDLQIFLAESGHNPGGADGLMGPRTAQALMSYVAENPESLAGLNSHLMRDLITHGHANQLVAMGSNSQALHAITQNALAAAEAANFSDYSDVRHIQTLLTVSGFSPGGIDGIYGNMTRNAAASFTAAMDPQTPAPPSAPEYTSQLPQPAPWAADGVDNGYGVPQAVIDSAWATLKNEPLPASMVPVSYEGSGRPLVIIDLGHGVDIGSNGRIDQGAVSPHVTGPDGRTGLTEVDVVDPLGQALAERLHASGYDVVFTRNPGEEYEISGSHGQTLTTRAQFSHIIANELGAQDVTMISLHADSSSNPNANGARIYVQGSNTTFTNESSSDLAVQIAGNFDIGSDNATSIRAANFNILRTFEDHVVPSTNFSAVLIETGFLSNRQDAEALKALSENPAQAAEQIARGIESFMPVPAHQQDMPYVAQQENPQSPLQIAYAMAHDHSYPEEQKAPDQTPSYEKELSFIRP